MSIDVLLLEDYSGMNSLDDIQEKLREDVASEFDIDKSILQDVEFLICYMSVGSWGCDSSSFYIGKRGNQVFEVNGSHCSCYGFEGQWDEEIIKTKEEMLSLAERWNFLGGYDSNPSENENAIKERIKYLATILF